MTDEASCHIRGCPLRDALRLLLNRRGEVVEAIHDGLRWETPTEAGHNKEAF